MFTGIQKIAVYDPIAFTSVVLNKILPDADVKVKHPLEVQDINANSIYDGDESFLEFGSFDLDKFEVLDSYMRAGTLINLVAAGLEHNLLWYEDTKIVVKKTYGFQVGNRNFFTIKLQKERGNHSIYALSNIVRIGGKWEDADNNNKADALNYVGDGTYYYDKSDNHQSITGGETGDIATTNRLNFPLPGITIFGKMNQKITGASQEWTYTLSAWDSNNNYLASATATNTDSVLSLSLPANTFKIRAQIEVANSKVVRFYLPYMGMQRANYLNINY